MSQGMRLLANGINYHPIIDTAAAKRLVNHLVRTPNDSIILPTLDYPGPVSREILKKDFKSLTICVKDEKTRNSLQAHISREFYDKRIMILPDDPIELSFRSHSNAAQSRCSEIVAQCLGITGTNDAKRVACDSNVKFLVPLMRSKEEVSFLRNLYYQMSVRLGLCANSLVHYYFLMSDRQWAYLSSKPGVNLKIYRSSSVLYNTIFDIKLLESFDLEQCFGIPLRKIQKTSPRRSLSYKKVHLIWLEPRLSTLKNFDARSLVEFRYLVTQMMHKRTGNVVEFLDRFFEDPKDDIAKLGVRDTTRIGDLDWNQYLKLYKYLKSREDYARSTFLQAVSTGEDSLVSL